ncbi:MAG TPA: bifunctional DNA-binding transcriptional regulator/O6-methylguanine-DNA methyltransferase Ada [Caulobacteraceae bacterium]|jgi:AraC family transcriptional regulator of adaptative response/methylated-DNA-[protein]-cysteine methyltransferase|nr:bifunctional DNA-binding transcriptional regulator/O6-methylguanine-DNA methyltransferase Ada [Caulobacteraceae bacterium]
MFDTMTAAELPSEDARYAAFVRRDKTMRSRGVMAVKTTGVYCRAGCPARMPKRENVQFFTTSEEARAAGFRACKRCKPDEAASPNAALVARACRAIEEAETAPNLDALADQSGLSPFHFHRVFKAETGVTPGQYAAQVRDQRAKAALKSGASVTEAVYDAGYGSSSRFYDGADTRFGMRPRAYRDKGRGEEIRLALAESTLGWVLVAVTARGICAVEIGDDPQAMIAAFTDSFHNAHKVEGDKKLERLVKQVVTAIDRPGASLKDLPLDIRGTAFQQRVWNVLRQIPSGETWTYAQVAQAAGAPKAVRAVGMACGSNPVSIVIPCHRVVGSNKKLTGYRWGVERKRELLKREGVG